MIRRPFLALALVCGVASVVVRGQDTNFRARHEVVSVDVLVSDHGRPVKGLTPQDFEIFDSGVAQQVEVMSFDSLPINAVLALDVSGSVSGDRLAQLRRASRVALDVLRPTDRAALISFTHAIQLGAALTTDRARVLSAFDHLQTSGATALYDAAYTGMALCEIQTGRSLLIILSDGHDTSSWLSADDALDIAKRSGVVVYGVSVKDAKLSIKQDAGGRWQVPGSQDRAAAERAFGQAVPDARPQFLEDLTALTGGSLVEGDSLNNLDKMLGSIVQEFRDRYVIGFSPTDVADAGWHRIDVRVKGRADLTVKARPGYQRTSAMQH